VVALKSISDTCRMKYIIVSCIFFCFCTSPTVVNKVKIQNKINQLINNWHTDAANANLAGYIGLMDSTCNYIGTDASENWKRDEFAAFCKPYFDKKTTWDFKTLQRDVQLNADGNTAWFDEILDTHMGTCRGSGALELINGVWKLRQYVLSVAIPNESMNAVKKAKHTADSAYLSNFRQ
jgi:hypothetical protein